SLESKNFLYFIGKESGLLHVPHLQLSSTISIPISFGTWIRISWRSARSSASISMSLLCTLICQRSKVAVPSPSGLLRIGTTSLFVGSGMGPARFTPVRSAISRILSQTVSTLLKSVPVRRILAFCIMIHTKKYYLICFGCMAIHIPAAIVDPISRTANLPNCGSSLTFSMTIGFVGLTWTMAASPVFKNVGFSSLVWPDRGSSFFLSSMNVHAVCVVWQWKTGVYPTVIALGCWSTTTWAVNSSATVGG